MSILSVESKTLEDGASRIYCIQSKKRRLSSQSGKACDRDQHSRVCLGVLRAFAAISLLAMTAFATAQEAIPRRTEPVRRTERLPEGRQLDKPSLERAEGCFSSGNCLLRPPLIEPGQLSPRRLTVKPWEPPSLFPFHPEFGFPMDLREAQRRLDALGYKVSVDGKIGPKTHLALSKFQKDNGLPITGLVDDATAEKLRIHDHLTFVVPTRSKPPAYSKDLLSHLDLLSRLNAIQIRRLSAAMPDATLSHPRHPESPYGILSVQRSKESTVISLTSDGSTKQWVVAEGDSTGSAQILEQLSRSKVIVHEGDPLPDALLAALGKGHHYVRKSKLSPNTDAEAATAAELGEKSLNLSTTNFYNALPQESGFASYMELKRMGLKTSQRKDWQALSASVAETAASLGLPFRVAQKAEFVADLAQGTKDIVVLIAHSDGESIYLSGAGGESISLQEISKISRAHAPDRIIVAIVCEGGGVNGDQPSLAELLLKNRLAKTVFASPKPVDARNVPELLRQLSAPGAKLWEVLDSMGLQQHAVVVPFSFWHQPFMDEKRL